MKKYQKRFIVLVLNLICLVVGLYIILKIFNENIIFFFTPTELIQNVDKHGKDIRLGGVVKKNSVKKDGNKIEFIVTDFESEIIASYTGILPDLFKEESGAVLQGKFINQRFEAKELLSKHDEKYMPKEVSEAIKKSGQWKPN